MFIGLLSKLIVNPKLLSSSQTNSCYNSTFPVSNSTKDRPNETLRPFSDHLPPLLLRQRQVRHDHVTPPKPSCRSVQSPLREKIC